MDIETMLEQDSDYADLLNSFVEKEVEEVNPNIKPFVREEVKSPSFTKPVSLEEPKVQTKKPNQKQFIIRNIYIDKMNTKSIRVELTPSVCEICAFDVAAKVHGRWGLVPVSERDTVIQALAEHKRVVHTLGDLHIVTEDQLPKQWLGSTF